MKRRFLMALLVVAASAGSAAFATSAAAPSSAICMASYDEKVIAEVLTLAAPEFELTVPAMFNAYYDGLVGIVQDDEVPNLFHVTYGGVGIQILIDAT